MPDTPDLKLIRETMTHTVASKRYGAHYDEHPYEHPVSRTLRGEVEPHVDAILEEFPLLAALMGYIKVDRQEFAVKVPSDGADAYDRGESEPFRDRAEAELHAEARRKEGWVFHDPDAAVVQRWVSPWVPAPTDDDSEEGSEG